MTNMPLKIFSIRTLSGLTILILLLANGSHLPIAPTHAQVTPNEINLSADIDAEVANEEDDVLETASGGPEPGADLELGLELEEISDDADGTASLNEMTQNDAPLEVPIEPEGAMGYKGKKLFDVAKRAWTDDEVIALGYIPDEVVVRFMRDKIDLSTENGRQKAKAFVENKGQSMAPKVLSRLGRDQEKSSRLAELHPSERSGLQGRFFAEKEQLSFANASVLKLAMDDSVMEAIEELRNDPDVESAMPNYVVTFQAINDPEYTGNNQWGAQKIKLQEAADLMTGTIEDVVVAVLDTGLSFSHPEFNSSNLWDGSDETGDGCKNDNGDDIEGGCPNHGWDFVNDDASPDDNPQDDHGHGTNVAGIIGAIKNTTGIAGTSSNVKMMIVKVGNSYGTMVDVAQGINFAKWNEAKIINASFGTYFETKLDVSDEIDAFLNSGSKLFVAGAGNDKKDNGTNPFYPASYTLNGIISVAATEGNDDIWEDGGYGSNWGDEEVDIAAPGHNIRTTDMTREVKFSDGFTGGFMGDMSQGAEFPNYWDAVLWSSIGGELYTDATNAPDDDEDISHYAADMEASVISDDIDLTGATDDTAILHFDVWCDTEFKGSKEWQPDYLDVYVEAPGQSPFRLNGSDPISEESLSLTHPQAVRNGLVGRIAEFTSDNSGLGYVIPDNYITSETQIRFVWNTDEDDVGGPYRGCGIDNIEVMVLDEDTYSYEAGTSLASPFVTGVAAMIWGKYPQATYNYMTASEVKRIIMESGDPVADLHPITGGHKTVSGKRLNAYRALVMAQDVVDQESASNETILYPTIRSKSGTGNWNSSSTWIEGRVPNSSDVVKINGTVTVNTSGAVVRGLWVSPSAVLQARDHPSGGTVTVTEALVNNGTMKDYNWSSVSPLNIKAEGTVENRGYLRRLFLQGASPTLLGGSQAVYSMYVDSTGAQTDGLPQVHYLETYSGKTLTVSDESTIGITGDLVNNGTLAGMGTVSFIGSSIQKLKGSGASTVVLTAFGGLGNKQIWGTQTLEGNVEIADNTIVEARDDSSGGTLLIGGYLTNDGTLRDYGNISSRPLVVKVDGVTDNNGGSINELRLTGLSPNVIGGTGYITHFYVDSTGATAEGVTEVGTFEVLSGKTLNVTSGADMRINGDMNGSGSVTGAGTLTFKGTSFQKIKGTGTNPVALTVFEGTGNKEIWYAPTFGNVEVKSGTTVHARDHVAGGTLVIKGDLTNAGTIRNHPSSSVYKLIVQLYGDLDNTYSITCNDIQAWWDEDEGATSYQFRITDDGPGSWGSETSTGSSGTETFFSIKPYVSQNRQWQWRSYDGEDYSEWSEAYDIN